MAQIKFVRGIKNNYKAESDHLDAIFFATDTHELLVNGEVYGLGRAVSDITYDEGNGSFNLTFVGNIDEEHNKPQNITISIPTATNGGNPGLMSGADKAALDKLVGSGDGSIQDLIQDAINTLTEKIDNYSVNTKTFKANSGAIVIGGADIQLTGYTATADSPVVEADDTVNAAIAKLEEANEDTKTALNAFIATKGQANGIASLDENGKVPASQLNGQLAHVFGVDGVATSTTLEEQSPKEGDIYYTTDTKKFYNYNGSDWDEPMDPKGDTIYNFRNSDKEGDTGRKNILYRWDGKDLVEISESLALGETEGTAYEGSKGKANRDALNSIPTTVVTGFGEVTPAANNVSIAVNDSDKASGNIFSAGDGATITLPAATTTKAGVMTAADKTYIDEVKTVLGNDASALGNVLKVNNAGIGILAGYSTAAAAADIEPDDTINEALGKLEKALNDLTGEGGEGSIQEQIQSAIDAIKGGASADYDTLIEIENAIKNKEVTAIQYNNATRILTLVKAGGNLTVTLPEATSASAGLMSVEDKKALDKAVADITANKVVAADTSIVVGTDNTNTTLKVKVKEGDNALKLDGGGLFVDQAALTSYEGLNAITITNKADSAGVKEVALKISANDKVLSQSADGLLATFSIAKLGSANEGYAASYQLQDKEGNAMGVTIDIPKDMVVSKGEVKTVETAEQPYAGAVIGDKYIDLTIANATTDHLYIPVKDLVDVYTAGNGIDVSGSNVISAKIDAATEGFLTVGADGIKLAGVQDAINTAKATIDAYKVNNKSISTNPVLNGADIALTGYTPVTGGTVAAADTINAAINKLETSLVWYTV